MARLTGFGVGHRRSFVRQRRQDYMQPLGGIREKLYFGVCRQPYAPLQQYLFGRMHQALAQSYVLHRSLHQFSERAVDA